MRLIDADAALNSLTEYWDSRCMPPVLDGETATYVDCKLIIKRQPTIDAVPVVRCRECELWNDWDQAGHKELGNFVCSCAYWSNEDGYVVYTAPDDYCSYAEREDGDGDG